MQRPAQFGQYAPVPFRITVVDERLISRMRRHDGLSVLDRTPVLLGPCGDFARVREETAGVTAERAVDFLDGVQIGELVPVQYEIASSWHDGDSIDRKADPLKQR